MATYQGGLTKGVFMKLFAITSKEADALPRTTHKRFGGGVYFLYHKEAVDITLAAGGVKAWRDRLRIRAENPCIARWPSQRDCIRRNSQQEERLRARASQQAAWRLVRIGV